VKAGWSKIDYQLNMSNMSSSSNAIAELPSPSSKKGLKGLESGGYLEGENVINKKNPSW
jgi:hypothetical protein